MDQGGSLKERILLVVLVMSPIVEQCPILFSIPLYSPDNPNKAVVSLWFFIILVFTTSFFIDSLHHYEKHPLGHLPGQLPMVHIDVP